MKEQDQILIKMWNDGNGANEISLSLGKSKRWVWDRLRLLRDHYQINIPKRSGQGSKIPLSVQEDILRIWRTGAKVREVAEQVGVHQNTVKNVISIARKAGVELPFRSSTPDRKPIITVREVKKIVCELADVSEASLVSPSRRRELLKPRQIAMALAYKYSGSSLPSVGRLFGGRDHTTVLHAVRIAEMKYAKGYRKVEERILAQARAAGSLREDAGDQREGEREQAGHLLRHPAHELDDRPS